jgi:hypothetical protein
LVPTDFRLTTVLPNGGKTGVKLSRNEVQISRSE